MTDQPHTRSQAVTEALYCERILAKTGDSVLHRTLGGAPTIAAWQHFPPNDVFDPETGAQWYYHCHPPAEGAIEHGHFHCFVRPEGREGPIHHLVAIGVDPHGRLVRLFTVNHWVVGGDWLDAAPTIALLPRFDPQVARPCFLVNRWLASVVRLYADDIAGLIVARDAAIGRHASGDVETARADRTLEVTAEAKADLQAVARSLAEA